MQAGRLDRQVDILQRVDTRDAFGDPVPTWTTFASGVWAGRNDLRGQEVFAARQVQAQLVTAWRIRWREGVLPTMRILDGDGITWEIEAILLYPATGRREGLELIARALL